MILTATATQIQKPDQDDDRRRTTTTERKRREKTIFSNCLLLTFRSIRRLIIIMLQRALTVSHSAILNFMSLCWSFNSIFTQSYHCHLMSSLKSHRDIFHLIIISRCRCRCRRSGDRSLPCHTNLLFVRCLFGSIHQIMFISSGSLLVPSNTVCTYGRTHSKPSTYYTFIQSIKKISKVHRATNACMHSRRRQVA